MQEEIEKPEVEDGDSDLYEHYRITVDKGQSPMRIDKFLMDKIPNATRNKSSHKSGSGAGQW